MPLEIERKFLVSAATWRERAHERVAMRHGYLTPLESPASVRVRVEGSVGKLNVKQAITGASRAEYEYTSPAVEAEEMLRTLCRGLILKTRHYVNHAGHLWEIDEFEGDNAGLVVAEIELQSEDEAFAHPEWLGAEITALRRYYNNALASRPYAQWSESERTAA